MKKHVRVAENIVVGPFEELCLVPFKSCVVKSRSKEEVWKDSNMLSLVSTTQSVDCKLHKTTGTMFCLARDEAKR